MTTNDHVKIDWLLQAGFRIRSADTTIAIDPYLSDRCAEIYGLQRRAPAPVAPDQLDADTVLVSHWHEDHLDLPTLQAAAERGATLVGPPSCIDRMTGAGIPAAGTKAIERGQTIELGNARIIAVPARHAVPGYITEDAVGYVDEVAGARIYHSGDTEYDRSLLTAGSTQLDLALVCVNGTGGNMNAAEAAILVHQLHPRRALPMHIGLWTPAGYGPEAATAVADFTELSERLTPGTTVIAPDATQPLTLTSNAA